MQTITIEQYDHAVSVGNRHVYTPEFGIKFAIVWTGWKRRYDPRLFGSSDPNIPTDPIDDSIAGQWVAWPRPESDGGIPAELAYYVSVPGCSGVMRRGEKLENDIAEGQVRLTIDTPADICDSAREEGLSKLLDLMRSREFPKF